MYDGYLPQSTIIYGQMFHTFFWKLPYVDKISRGFNFVDDENFQFRGWGLPKKIRVDLISR